MGSLRFILGRAGSGKTTRVLDEIAALLAADPLGPPIVLLVPDQATLLYERLAAARAPRGGYLRLRVTTFRQFATLLLSEVGGEAMFEVTALGRRILIGRLLRRLGPQLDFYRSASRQPGLAGTLDDAFAELENADADERSLRALAASIAALHPLSPLPAKLRDIATLFVEYERLLGTDRLDPRRRQRLALDAVARCPLVPSMHVFVDAFYDLARAERQMLYRLAESGAKVAVALDVDPSDVRRPDDAPPSPSHPLRVSTAAFRRLRRGCAESRIGIEYAIHERHPRFLNDALLHLERNFEVPRPGRIAGDGAVRFVEAADRRGECDAAARQVLDWVRGGYRLRDCVVLCRDLAGNAAELGRAFREHGLPHFIDRPVPASHQPLIRAARAALALAESDWQPDRVMELLKTGVVGADADTCDALENYLLAHRIAGREAWRAPWNFSRHRRRGDDDAPDSLEVEDLAKMNAARAHLIASIEPLLPGGDAVETRTAQWCQRLCRALDRLGVRAALERRVAELERLNDRQGALQAREVWREFAELLDQLCTVLGDEALSLAEFADVMDVALERVALAIVPPTIDQVLIGGVGRTRTGDVRGCVVVGLNEGQFPLRHDEPGALSDDDRRLLDEQSVEVRPSSRSALLDEQYLAYLAFTRPRERLTLVRQSVDASGKPLLASVFWTQCLSCFREPRVEPAPPPGDVAGVSTGRALAEAVLHAAGCADAAPAARRLARHLFASDDARLAPLRASLLAGLDYDNAAALAPAVALSLYGEPMPASVSRLETFAACPFKQFAQHGLRLRPRDEADLSLRDVGSLYHRVLEGLVRQIIADRGDLAAPMPDLDRRIRELGERAAGELRDELLLTPGRSQHLLESMERTLVDVADTQRYAAGLGQFRPSHAELAFGGGREGDAPPLVLETPAGRRVALRGRIDRVDTLFGPESVAASVIDYKLGAHAAKFDRIYFGLSLQLLAYLLVLASLGEKWIGRPVVPAAALYVKLSRRIERVRRPADAPEPGTIEFALGSKNRARGIVDARFVGGFDSVTESGDTSPAYSLKISDQPIDGRDKDAFSPESFAQLIDWARGKIGALADEILDGRVAVEPYRHGTETPCPRCDFRSVCRLDLTFNRYRNVDVPGAAALDKILGREGEA